MQVTAEAPESYDFSYRGADYSVQAQSTLWPDMREPKGTTQVFFEGDSEAFLVLNRVCGKDEVRAAIDGYIRGLDVGARRGKDEIKRGFCRLFDVPELADVGKLDERMDKIEARVR